jgi:predicted enzyme related to lactoylglutathione lyase
MAEERAHGSIVWTDLTVADAVRIRDFYAAVVGWGIEPVSMGDYSDFSMVTPGDKTPIAGVCHARGPNARLPPQWLIYVSVPNLDASVRRCLELGGKVVDGPRSMGEKKFCVIQDPAGAVAGLIGD